MLKCFFAVFALFVFCAQAGASPLPRIAVMDVETRSVSIKREVRRIFSDNIADSLYYSGSFRITPRGIVSRYFLGKKKKLFPRCPTNNCRKKIAKELRADLLLKVVLKKKDNNCVAYALLYYLKEKMGRKKYGPVSCGSCRERDILPALFRLQKEIHGKAILDALKIRNTAVRLSALAFRPQSLNKLQIKWITIKGGKFLMKNNNSSPVHEVKISTFYIQKTEVTAAQYRACINAGWCTPPLYWATEYLGWGNPTRKNRPIEKADWNQARNFCRWIGGRLPSEAEWEFAARSRGKRRNFPWGDMRPTCSKTIMHDSSLHQKSGCGKDETWPVCSKPKGNTEQGLCDMAGNAWEWVEDCWHESYIGAPKDGRPWIGSCIRKKCKEKNCVDRVMRGGSMHSKKGHLSTTNREPAIPGITEGYPLGPGVPSGFRCVKGIKSDKPRGAGDPSGAAIPRTVSRVEPAKHRASPRR